MKVILGIVFCFMIVISNCKAQEDLRIMRLNKFEMKESVRTGAFEEMDNAHIPPILNDRYNLMGYKPLKFEGYRIISSHQPNSNFDIVYFIDKHGNTTKKIMAIKMRVRSEKRLILMKRFCSKIRKSPSP